VPDLIEEWGCLGITRAAARARTQVHHPWTDLLVDDPLAEEAARSELFSDWIRLSGLMDYAVGLLGLLRDPDRTSDVVEAIRSLVGSRPSDAEQIRDAFPDGGWARELLGGAARMNMSCDLDEDAKSVRLTSRQPGPSEARDLATLLSFTLTGEGIAETLADLVNDWLPTVHPFVVSVGSDLEPAYRLPSDLLSILWLQLANTLAEDRALKVCAFDRCPGPPARPRVFFWRYGVRAGPGSKESSYCHPLCAKAASAARRRATRKGTERAEPAEPTLVTIPDVVAPEELGL
jgi:hypothetical protein